LAEYEGPDAVVTSQELYKTLKEMEKGNGCRFMSSGIPSLDGYIKGFYGGEVTVISGPTKHGKTLLAQTLTREFADQEKNCLWFTYEVPGLQFLEQFGEPLPGFFMPLQLKGNSLDWIEKRVYEAKLKYGLDAVFVDHLHYLIDMSRHSMSLEIGHVMRFLKKMAVHHNIAIFVIAHIAKISLDTEPDETHLRDSSFVGQEADNCLMVWRSKVKEYATSLKVALNRRFGVMGKKIDLMKIGNFLREVENGYAYGC